MPLDASHHPALQSWVASANNAATDFPIQNLPYGRMRRAGSSEAWRMGVAMADYRGNGEVSFILQMPVWWGYAASMLPACIGVLVYALRLLEDLGLATAPADLGPAGGGH